MKRPYSIHMETIWHGAKSLAYRLRAECFVSNEQNCNSLFMDLRKSNASKHIGLFPEPYYTSLFYCISSYTLTGIIAAQSTDMQYIILFLKISNRETKDALDQLI